MSLNGSGHHVFLRNPGTQIPQSLLGSRKKDIKIYAINRSKSRKLYIITRNISIKACSSGDKCKGKCDGLISWYPLSL